MKLHSLTPGPIKEVQKADLTPDLNLKEAISSCMRFITPSQCDWQVLLYSYDYLAMTIHWLAVVVQT